MATWLSVNLNLNGSVVQAQAPVIVSASRSTDIPAFYADWFFDRLKKGYSVWTNPFNGVKSYISYEKTRFIVFWSKNPRPLLGHLEELKQRGIGCYIQFSLNDYEEEGLERGVPSLMERIETFKLLVEVLGKGSVVWRFDPLMLTDSLDLEGLLRKVERVGNLVHAYTEKLVFSFADIAAYRKVQHNLEKNGIRYREWTPQQMEVFASKLVKLNRRKGWNLVLATCGEQGDYPGVQHNRCVDDELMIRRAHTDKGLMDFLKVKIFPMPVQDLFGGMEPLPEDAICLGNGFYATRGDNRDKGQRLYCGCVKSKDIGQYNTCIHGCEYCYANTSKQAASANYKNHLAHPFDETITGK